MKKEAKNLKRKIGLPDLDFANCKKVMSSNLPLLFANGQPRSLETISQPELEEFVPFMVRCSLGQEPLRKPKEINSCAAPEWWPQGFPFKFPLIEQTDWINRLVMLKSLVCRCYTFYDCEFLLKFSSELAEMSPSHLRFDGNKEENTTSIYDANGCMLVKCRNENINYDLHKNHRRYLSPAHRSSLNQAKKFEPVIDLTFDTSSEDEKEVYFKETARPASRKTGKRKTSVEQNEEPAAKQRCFRRVFDDFPKELPEPTVYTQEQYMEKFQLIPLGKEIKGEILKVERKKRLANSFNILSITSRRGQELLVKNKHSFNLEASLERTERYCGQTIQDDGESSQVYTRSAAVFSAMYKQDEENKPEDQKKEENDETKSTEDKTKEEKWFHSYKFPHRTNNPVYPYKGPTVVACSVVLNKLTEADILHHTAKKNICNTSTMTPEEWWSNDMAICKCQLTPGHVSPVLISGLKYKNKKSSTRCTCNRSKSQYVPSPDSKTSLSEVRMEACTEEMHESPAQESSAKSRSRTSHENTWQRSGGLNDQGCSHSGSECNSITITYSCCSPAEASLIHKRALFRRPLAVVPSTLSAVGCSFGCLPVSDAPCQSPPHLPPSPQYISPTASIKVNFSRSILDAVKWYSKDDLTLLSSDTIAEEIKDIDLSQENIKPYTELTLPNLVKPIDYFQQNLNAAEYDYCSRLVTRRGERHYVRREPCPSCFQGRDNFCVYEFVRQAKLAGLPLQENQKHLESMFFKFITAVNKKS